MHDTESCGLGLYRHSDIGLTFDVSIRNYKSETPAAKYTNNETRVKFDNFGYVGVVDLNGAMRNFQWGVSYNRLAVLDRHTTAYNYPTSTSLSNYISWYTNGVNSEDLIEGENYDPYFDSSNDWLSILAFNSFMINNPATISKSIQACIKTALKATLSTTSTSADMLMNTTSTSPAM